MTRLDFRETGKRRIRNSQYRKLFKRILLLMKTKIGSNVWTSEVF